MARPQKNNVDYFPHDCSHGRKMFVIESKYGNDGYAVWFKLLEQIGVTENHYLDLRDETQQMYLTSLMKVSVEKLNDILIDLSKLDAIDKYLFDKYKIIYSKKFIEGVQDLYTRRNNKCMTYDELCNKIDSSRELMYTETNLSLINVDINTQSIVKESIVNEIKEEESILEIKNSNSEFDQFDEIDLEKSDILKTWIKYKKEKNEEIKSSMQIESIFKTMLDVDIGDLKIIINQTITSGAKNIIWNYANELKQKNQKNETGNKQSKNTYDETLAKLGSNLY
jgi:hypothetical protein